MKNYLIASLVAVTTLVSTFGFAHETKLNIPPDGVDIGFLLMPELAQNFINVPSGSELQEVVRVGARALDWVDLLQRDVPPAEREQIWRRADRIGKEATPDNPLHYNGSLILERYRQAFAALPQSVATVISARSALPASPPEGMTAAQVVLAVKEIHNQYSRASRWMALYQWHEQLQADSRDFRGWLELKKNKESLDRSAAGWSGIAVSERHDFIEKVSLACPLALGRSVADCQRSYMHLVDEASQGNAATQLLAEVYRRGEGPYNARFGVRTRFNGATRTNNGGVLEVNIPMYRVPGDILAWIQERVTEAWSWRDVLITHLSESNSPRHAVKVNWENGALPHVNGVGGDTITMDANTPRWLEHTQVVMRHEFGHVLGFTDCYTEFWDESLNGFTYYTLDPNDAMCALSGEYLDRHRDAMLVGYSPNR